MSDDAAAARPEMDAAESRDALHNLCLADAFWRERYEGWTLIGRGGAATVVRTRSRALGEDIALKVFHGLTTEDWYRFRQEVSAAQRLTSPLVVRTFSPFPRGSLAWIEMELVDGPDLRQELERRTREERPYSIDEAVAIALAVAEALLAAHGAGIIHRDVKPANVLLPRSGRPMAKLGDFGISRLVGAARVTRTGLLTGTPQFAAPEVIAGQTAGPSSDVYSLALVLYLLLSNNRFPFELTVEAPATAWLRAHRGQAPRHITTHNPDVPPGIAELLERGLAKDPEGRPSASEFREVLIGTAARPHGPTPRPVAGDLPNPPRRRGLRAVAIGGGALVVMAAAVGGWMLRRPLSAPVAERTADAFLTAASPSPLPSSVSSARTNTFSAPSRASPVRPGSPSGPPSRPTSAPILEEVAALFTASATADLIMVTNISQSVAADVRVTLVGSKGERYSTTEARLVPDERVSLALEAFVPVPPDGFRLARIEVSAADPPQARRTVVFPAP